MPQMENPMPLHSVARRPFSPQASEPVPVNWRRGLFRVWALVAAAWIMSWTIHLIVNALEGGLKASDILVIPVVLFGPPVALLIFGVATGWAFRGFKVEKVDTGE
jgi:predicted cation transporter